MRYPNLVHKSPDMDFFPTLENKRVLLRPLQLNDVQQLQPLALAEPDLFTFMATFIGSERDLIQFVEDAVQKREQAACIPFVVIDKASDTLAGTTRFTDIELRHKRAELGYTWISSRFHQTGLNKAMKYLMLQHAFEIMHLNRVEIKTNELNLRSRHAIESIGASYEGRFRHHMINHDGSLRNTIYYSIIKEEWPELKQRVFGKFLADWE